MEELLEWYEKAGMPLPLDIHARAVDVYGFIIEDNYPLEDEIHDEEAE